MKHHYLILFGSMDNEKSVAIEMTMVLAVLMAI